MVSIAEQGALRRRPEGALLARVMAAALAAVDPVAAVERTVEGSADWLCVDGHVLPLEPGAGVWCVAVGKAAPAMAAALVRRLPWSTLHGGVVVAKHPPAPAHARVLALAAASGVALPVVLGAHPVPDARSEAAGRAVLEVLARVTRRRLDYLAACYAELGAFLSTANEGIRNRRFRPDFAIRPPAQALDTEVLVWPGEVAISITGEFGHLYVETSSGDRLLDTHASKDQVLGLRLPAERPLFVRRADNSVEFKLTGLTPTHLSALTAYGTGVTRRGALHLAFEQLFHVP